MGTFTVSTVMETVNVPIIDLARRIQSGRSRRVPASNDGKTERRRDPVGDTCAVRAVRLSGRRAQALRTGWPFRVRSDEHVLFASRSEPERATMAHFARQRPQRSRSRGPFVDAPRLANSCDAYMPTNIPTSTATKNWPTTASMTASIRAVGETASTSP